LAGLDRRTRGPPREGGEPVERGALLRRAAAPGRQLAIELGGRAGRPTDRRDDGRTPAGKFPMLTNPTTRTAGADARAPIRLGPQRRARRLTSDSDFDNGQ